MQPHSSTTSTTTRCRSHQNMVGTAGKPTLSQQHGALMCLLHLIAQCCTVGAVHKRSADYFVAWGVVLEDHQVRQVSVLRQTNIHEKLHKTANNQSSVVTGDDHRSCEDSVDVS